MNPFKPRTLPLSDTWLNRLKKDIEESYLRYKEPWKQSGFMMSEEDWVKCRKPVADCMDKSGTFLDISCSIGYLLESVLSWTKERGLSITPYGIDASEKLIKVAKTRLTAFENNLVVANAMSWVSPLKYDFVRADLSYVLIESQEQFLQRIFNNFLTADGKVILCEFRSKGQDVKEPWSLDKVKNWDFKIVNQVSTFYDKIEMTRVMVVTRQSIYK